MTTIELSWNQIYLMQQLIGEELERIYAERKVETCYNALRFKRMIGLELITDKLAEMRKTAY